MLRALLLAAWGERDAAAAARDALAAERDSVVVERDALAERIERLQHLLRKLLRMQFGPRSERLPDEQLQFAFEEVEASLADNEAEAEKRSPDLRQKKVARRRAGRGRLPAHLPRIEQVLLPESTAYPCCRGAMVEIGCDTAERFDVIPVQFRALVTKRPKFACRAKACDWRCSGMWSAYRATATCATAASVGMPPSISRVGAVAWTTTPSQARQAYFGRLVTSTRNCAGSTSSRSAVSAPISTIAP